MLKGILGGNDGFRQQALTQDGAVFGQQHTPCVVGALTEIKGLPCADGHSAQTVEHIGILGVVEVIAVNGAGLRIGRAGDGGHQAGHFKPDLDAELAVRNLGLVGLIGLLGLFRTAAVDGVRHQRPVAAVADGEGGAQAVLGNIAAGELLHQINTGGVGQILTHGAVALGAGILAVSIAAGAAGVASVCALHDKIKLRVGGQTGNSELIVFTLGLRSGEHHGGGRQILALRHGQGQLGAALRNDHIVQFGFHLNGVVDRSIQTGQADHILTGGAEHCPSLTVVGGHMDIVAQVTFHAGRGSPVQVRHHAEILEMQVSHGQIIGLLGLFGTAAVDGVGKAGPVAAVTDGIGGTQAVLRGGSSGQFTHQIHTGRVGQIVLHARAAPRKGAGAFLVAVAPAQTAAVVILAN